MTHTCLTYIASSAVIASAFAYPSSDSQETFTTTPRRGPWPPYTTTPKPMAQPFQPPDSSGNRNYDLSPDDVRYLESIASISQRALDEVRGTLQTIDSPPLPHNQTPAPQVPSWQINREVFDIANSIVQHDHPNLHPHDTANPLPPPKPPHKPKHDMPTTPQYYDPYYGGDHNYKKDGSNAVALGLGLGIPMGIIATFLCVGLIFWCRKRKQQNRNVFPLPFPRKGNDYEAQLDSPAYSIHDPWLLDRNLLEINYSKKLGSGAFCNVFKAKINGEAPVSQIHPGVRTQQLRDCPVAVKMLPSFADDIARSDFMQEINFMKSLAYHPHLVSMLGFVSDRKSPYLLVEFCEQGDLLHLIRSRRDEIIKGPAANPDGLKIKDLLMFSWQISNGLEYLNSIGCIHRDIAARNVLVDSSNTCKIGDFGLCRLTDSLLYTARGGRLPLKWMAPESLSSYEYSFKSDVWSYGVLLWELFSLGEVPYAEVQTTDLLETHRSGKRLEQPPFCPDEIYEVMTSCWQFISDDRPTFQHICRLLATMLENATAGYGYLIPTTRKETSSPRDQNNEECDNV